MTTVTFGSSATQSNIFRHKHLDCTTVQKVAERLLLPLIEPHIQSHICLWTKPVRRHQGPWSEGRTGLPQGVVASCAQPPQESWSFFFSDVSGDFDRVRAERLLEKLRCKGVHPTMIALAGSRLQQRTAQVVVEGSDKVLLKNMVFPGNRAGAHPLEPLLRGCPTRYP